MRRIPILDRLLLLIARGHASRMLRQFLTATRDARAVQDAALLSKLRRNADSDFGRAFGFASIRSYADYVRQVPILQYEDHQPYIERVKRGELSALFGAGQRVHMFALTSGTTNEPKYIPVTDDFLAETRRGWNACGVKALLDHPQAFLRPIVQVSSRMDESRTEAGIPCGAVTGLMAATQKRLVRRYYVTPLALAYIDDAAAKYYAIMRLAVPQDVAFIMTASPATVLSLARTADRHAAQLIRDIHDGTLWSALSIDASIRQAVRGLLKPSPATARRLERLLEQHGRLLPKHYWNLGFLGNWTGGSMGLYLREFPTYFGDTPVRDIGLLASEGRVTVPIEDHTPVGILDVMGHFFEFVPRDEYGSARPTVLRAGELEAGGEYFVLLTTSSGLYRYDLGDLVRMHGYAGEAPLLEFLSKGSHVASVAGEKLTEQQAILAMQHATDALGVHIDTFVLAPQWAEVPYYRLHVEAGQDWPADVTSLLAERLDQSLAAVNVEYASKRYSGRLGSVTLNVLPAGFLTAMDEDLRCRHRRGNEQYKHQYLYATPGADAAFPGAVVCASVKRTAAEGPFAAGSVRRPDASVRSQTEGG
ncbi:MAG: GH3 auxin-responsive promoter family protein [Phycisphaerae bacterium]|nr:GH3 auxin-responsive promoter family protein [Phycisphaerae bacterium]